MRNKISTGLSICVRQTDVRDPRFDTTSPIMEEGGGLLWMFVRRQPHSLDNKNISPSLPSISPLMMMITIAVIIRPNDPPFNRIPDCHSQIRQASGSSSGRFEVVEDSFQRKHSLYVDPIKNAEWNRA
ncbi:hypothetical protein CEXT_460171 [Caerostris extrusa]|uniref:Uncharacterized protein n=1 Tax=Caerostris extrusa TaxID=172846 RepID=A0AAV4WFA4_CAEEX|nr:hypothetical protein CEXT_460171 [Caerostris extrusa]